MVVLNSINEFAFRSGARYKICVLNNNAYWIKNISQMNGYHYSLISLKQAVKYLLKNCLFKVGSQILGKLLVFEWVQILPHSLQINLFHYESENKGKMKNIGHHCAKRFGHSACIFI